VKRTLKLTLLSLIAFVLIIVAMTSDLRQVPQSSLVWIEAQGAWGPFAFILLYILATVFFLPGSILTLGAGRFSGSLSVPSTCPSPRRLGRRALS